MSDERAIDRSVEGLDPFALMAAERARIDRYVATLDADALEQPSACEGWRVRDVVGHLAGSEEYNRACLHDDVAGLFTRYAERGASDVHSFNAVGVADRRDQPFAAVMDEWRRTGAENLEGLRALDGATVPTAVGPYPARWQAFHLAAELATHADDIDVPVDPAEAAARARWRAQVAQFLLREAKPDLTVDERDGGVRISGGGIDTEVDDATLVAATTARGAPGTFDPALAAALSLQP